MLPIRLLVLFLYGLALLLQPAAAQPSQDQEYDLVLQGGRVMDPETGLDDVRNVGILADRIAQISTASLKGREVVDVQGLVVAPGFIDLHAHGQTNQANEFQAHDGVTTALELESGKPFVGSWLTLRKGRAFLNYGASVSQSGIRWMSMQRYASEARKARRIVERDGLYSPRMLSVLEAVSGARYQELSDSELKPMVEGLQRGLEEGGLGIGVPVAYYPGASREEILRVFEFAAEIGVPIFSHVRDSNLAAIQEMVANAAVTGAPLHIVHLNSIALGHIDAALKIVSGAQKQGLDITTEVYPYTAASTSLSSTIFDEGWQERLDISYGDLQWEATGERLTEETFAKYRAQGGTVIIYMMRPEWIAAGVSSPVTMIASDGMPYARGAHPRSAGTFSRVLGRYVREEHSLTLMEGLAKMTLLPAKRLEKVAPSMHLKGRIQVGCDADITVFDPDTIIDTATFDKDLSFSRGVQYVLVNGTFVIKNGETVLRARPGRAVIGRFRR